MTEPMPDLSNYPLSKYFFSKYLSRNSDPINFPFDDVSDLLQKYENLLEDSLRILGFSKERLRERPEFNFDCSDSANLEASVAVLRVVCTLENCRFVNIALIRPGKDPGADIACEKRGRRVCCEVKAITKLRRPREECDYADEVEKKVRESIGKARSQLACTAKKLDCSVKLFACVMNWQIHPVLLRQDSYFQITRRLESDGKLDGIDGVLFVNIVGEAFMLVNTAGAFDD